jgi:hypothetical protein
MSKVHTLNKSYWFSDESLQPEEQIEIKCFLTDNPNSCVEDYIPLLKEVAAIKAMLVQFKAMKDYPNDNPIRLSDGEIHTSISAHKEMFIRMSINSLQEELSTLESTLEMKLEDENAISDEELNFLEEDLIHDLF